MDVPAFLHGTGTDNNGRTLDFILAQNNDWLEREHSYIQWVFPLLEESQQVHDAPFLTTDDVVAIKADTVALENQKRALARIIQFFNETTLWLNEMDHNHLRITRILKSLRLLQSLELAEGTYNLLIEKAHANGAHILPENIAYWTDALGLSYDKGNK